MDSNDVILYDINEYSTWFSEIDVNKDLNSIVKYKTQTNYNYLISFALWLKNRIRWRSNETTLRLSLTYNKPWNQWKIAISKKGYVAVLQENFIEVYKETDSYTDFIWRKEVKTTCSYLCCIAWNHRFDSHLLVFVNETGGIHIFDDSGKEQTQHAEVESIDYDYACNKVVFLGEDFLSTIKSTDVQEILLTTNYSGYINLYALNDFKISKLTTVSTTNIFPNGIYCAEVDSGYQYLITGSFSKGSKLGKKPTNAINGVAIWRLLNSEPWLKAVFLTHTISEIKSEKFKPSNSKTECVLRICVSPDNKLVAAVYNSGSVAIYSIPNLITKSFWSLTEQPFYNEMNNQITDNPSAIKLFKKIYSGIDFHIWDIGWWNESVLIVSRGTGLLSLSSITDFTNLMGEHQKWLSPYANLYLHSKNGYIVLDCACMLLSQSVTSDSEEHSDIENETINEDFDDENWSTYIMQAIKSQAYNWSGFEMLKPPAKKPKFLKRQFRLLHFKPTTPEELFTSKLNAEEYGEALQLAIKYDLDTDLVYQKQWRSQEMTKSSINDYLSKIKKRSWILHECLEKVPDNFDTVKYLIEFGLRGTDIDAVLAIKEKDDNRFVLCQNTIPEDLDDDDVDKFNPRAIKERNEKIKAFQEQKLKKLDIKNMNLMQKELCSVRVKLLSYMDRLSLYEEILGGKRVSAERFDAEKFKKIRIQPIIDMANDYAREGDADAVRKICSYYYMQLKNKQLDILSNFSETQDPHDYEILLPKIKDKKPVMFDEVEDLRTDEDWVEKSEIQEYLEKTTEIKQVDETSVEISVEKIEKWYETRVIEIECLSGLVDNSIKLCEIAIKNGCSNINKLLDDLLTLSTIIYECKSNNKKVDLKLIQKSSDLQNLNLIMSHYEDTKNDLYMKRIQEWLLPFIERRTKQERESTLREFLLLKSKEDLNPCLKTIILRNKLFQQQQARSQSKATLKSISSDDSIQMIQYEMLKEMNLTQIFIDCLYESEKYEQIDLCQAVLNQISTSNIGKVDADAQLLIENAQNHLRCCEIFRKYGVNKTLSYIKESASSEDKCREALVKLTWSARGNNERNFKKSEWVEFMKDLQHLHCMLYKDLISLQDSQEIFLNSLLGSRNEDNIKLAFDLWLKDFDKEAAVRLCVKSAQDYFNSATNHYDSDMEFAKQCLDRLSELITVHHSHAQKSSNASAVLDNCIKTVNKETIFINTTKIFADFNYLVLPVQVRTCENRYELIKGLLDKNPSAYKEHEKLIELASYLDDENVEKSRCRIRLLICENALTDNNLYAALNICKTIIKSNYAPAWKCAKEIAIKLILQYEQKCQQQQQQQSSTATRQIFNTIKKISTNINTILLSQQQLNSIDFYEAVDELLSFALTHCDNEYLSELLELKNDIEKEHAEKIKKELQTKTTREAETKNSKEIKINDKLDFNYNLQTIEEIKHTATCLEMLNYYLNNLTDNKECFIYYLNELIDTDYKTGIGYMIQVMESCLSLIENNVVYDSNVSYELILFVLALCLLNDETLIEELFDSSYQTESKQLIIYSQSSLYLINLLQNINENDANKREYLLKEKHVLFNLFKKIDKYHTEHKQNMNLNELKSGIDINRFKYDDDYKLNTIFGLAMDTKTFELACSLAKFHSVDIWLVYARYVEYLLTQCDNELTIDAIQKEIEPLLDQLKSDESRLEEYLYKNVYPLINGTNMDKLAVYFSLLGEKYEINVKLIKKLKPLFSNLNYKDFLSNPIQVITKLLDENNLQLFAKISSKIPKQDDSSEALNSSKIYSIYYLKKFWSYFDEHKNENYESDQHKVYEHYESLKEYLRKIDSADDYLHCVRDLITSEKSVRSFSLHVRKELLKRFVKLVKKLHTNDSDESSGFGKVLDEMNKIQHNLKLIENIDNSISKNEIELDNELKLKLDIELGKIQTQHEANYEKIENLLINMLFNGYKIEYLSELLKLIEIKMLTMKLLIKKSLSTLCDNVKKDENFIEKLKVLLETISNYLNNANIENKVLNEEDVMECMRQFCNDSTVEIDIRLRILEELKNYIHNMKSEDLILLLVYKTNAILNSCNCFGTNEIDYVSASDIDDEEKRYELFLKYIDHTNSLEKCDAMVSLLKTWPHFEDVIEIEQKPWNLMFIKLVKFKYSRFADLIKELHQDGEFNEYDLAHIKTEIFEKYIDKNMDDVEENYETIEMKILLLRLFLSFKNVYLINEYLNEIKFDKYIEKYDLLADYDDTYGIRQIFYDSQLIDSLIKDNFYAKFINTPIYALFVSYITKNMDKDGLMKIIKYLKSENQLFEASVLLAHVKNTHSSYRTLSLSHVLLDKFA